ncbi:MAG: hypothetical protein KGP01_02740, partial [Actinomycetales bacterium]|nr:hypothetical protein [Actinomycetales bacterium]
MDVASGRVAEWLRATRPKCVVVACSGGGDSLALAQLAAHHASQFGVALSAAVVDHGLQPGSADTAQVARDVCA